ARAGGEGGGAFRRVTTPAGPALAMSARRRKKRALLFAAPPLRPGERGRVAVKSYLPMEGERAMTLRPQKRGLAAFAVALALLFTTTFVVPSVSHAQSAPTHKK